jgi:hypothetical protein
MAFHARPDRIPTGRVEILSKGSCNRRTLSTCGGFPLPVRLPRVRGSLGGTSDIQLPDQRTALFRPARVCLYQQIRLARLGPEHTVHTLRSYRPPASGVSMPRNRLNPQSGTATLTHFGRLDGFPSDGLNLACPTCQGPFLYQRYELMHRPD